MNLEGRRCLYVTNWSLVAGTRCTGQRGDVCSSWWQVVSFGWLGLGSIHKYLD